MSKVASDEDKVGFGERMAAVRRSIGLNQTDFAHDIGVVLRAYQNWERGEREVPSSVLRKIYERYDIDLAWLLTGAKHSTTAQIPQVIRRRQVEE